MQEEPQIDTTGVRAAAQPSIGKTDRPARRHDDSDLKDKHDDYGAPPHQDQQIPARNMQARAKAVPQPQENQESFLNQSNGDIGNDENRRGKQKIRVLFLGDGKCLLIFIILVTITDYLEHVGKTSIIVTLISETFPRQVAKTL